VIVVNVVGNDDGFDGWTLFGYEVGDKAAAS
jgi:hypothetical protein